MMQTIREFFTASYDPTYNRIVGCRENSFAWFHELRHKKQFENKKVYGIATFFHMIFYAFGSGFLFLGMSNKVWLGGIILVAIPYLVFSWMLEIDAWIFGVRGFITKRAK